MHVNEEKDCFHLKRLPCRSSMELNNPAKAGYRPFNVCNLRRLLLSNLSLSLTLLLYLEELSYPLSHGRPKLATMADPGFEVPDQMFYVRRTINEPFRNADPVPKLEED